MMWSCGSADGTGIVGGGFCFSSCGESVILCFMAKNLVGKGFLLPHPSLFSLKAQGEKEGRE